MDWAVQAHTSQNGTAEPGQPEGAGLAPRARTAAAAAEWNEVPSASSSSSSVDFSALIAPLEAQAQHSLREPGRGRCLAAFHHDPERFRLLVEDALDRGRNPLALLVKMVTDRDHLDDVSAVNGNGRTNRRRYGRGVTSDEVLARAREEHLAEHLAKLRVGRNPYADEPLVASVCPHCEVGGGLHAADCPTFGGSAK